MTTTRQQLYSISAPDKLDAAAEALAHLRKMNDDLIAAHEEIDQLKADLHRERDRIALLAEDRDRYRAEMLTYRDLLIKLSTQMSNIGMMTIDAQDIVKQVYELTHNTAPSTALTTTGAAAE